VVCFWCKKEKENAEYEGKSRVCNPCIKVATAAPKRAPQVHAPNLVYSEVQTPQTCASCGERKDPCHYKRDRRTGKLHQRCLLCENAKAPLKPKTTRSPEEQRASRDSRLRSIYGINSADYDALFAAQKGKCAICPAPISERLAVDHCNIKGHVRGLLCTAHNVGIGNFDHDIRALKAAIKYLEKPPAPAILKARGVLKTAT